MLLSRQPRFELGSFCKSYHLWDRAKASRNLSAGLKREKKFGRLTDTLWSNLDMSYGLFLFEFDKPRGQLDSPHNPRRLLRPATHGGSCVLHFSERNKHFLTYKLIDGTSLKPEMCLEHGTTSRQMKKIYERVISESASCIRFCSKNVRKGALQTLHLRLLNELKALSAKLAREKRNMRDFMPILTHFEAIQKSFKSVTFEYAALLLSLLSATAVTTWENPLPRDLFGLVWAGPVRIHYFFYKKCLNFTDRATKIHDVNMRDPGTAEVFLVREEQFCANFLTEDRLQYRVIVNVKSGVLRGSEKGHNRCDYERGQP
ncbi:hypothetical protein RF11_08589 [Thelohanellus kitauei]|uniref:Uncharacterized protein n=1 Tax=Thelohanellus kitauei TaxID=669202 RepID=A0A0C2N2F2_THEKT|nr:hypothetical protein RF11_08589 [Thelohanellus kitauei]